MNNLKIIQDINQHTKDIAENTKDIESLDTSYKAIASEMTDKFDEVNTSLDTKANKSTTDNIQGQVDNLVLGAVGDGNNAEVIQARGSKDLLRQNIDNRIEKKFINLFNKNTITIGFHSNTIGASYPTGDGRTEFFFSELINVKDYDVLYLYSNWAGTNPCYIYKIANGKVSSYLSKNNGSIDVSSYDYLVLGGRNVDLQTTMLTVEVTNKYVNYDDYEVNDYVLNKTIKKESANIINQNNMMDGYQFATSGVYPYLVRSDMRISSLHKVKGNNLACLNNNTSGSIYIKFIKSDMTTNKTETIAPQTSKIIDCTDYAYYMYETLLTTALSNITLIYSDTIPSRVISNTENTIGNIKEINDLRYEMSLNNSYIEKMMLKGKKIVFDGDSITEGAGVTNVTTGIAPNNNKGWGYSIQQLCPQSVCYGFGKSGWRIGRKSGEETSTSLLDHISQYPSDVDIFVLSGGYNDLAQQMAIGELQKGFYNATYDEYTTIGALESWIKQLRVKYPLAQIIYVITGTRTFSDSENTLWGNNDTKGNSVLSLYTNNNEKFKFFMDNIEKTLNKWGVPYIDMRKNSGIVGTGADEKTIDINVQMWENGAGLHPTKIGYDTHFAPKILNKIRSVI